MYCFRKGSIKNGYILLYTLFIGILCMTISMCCFNYQMAIKKSNNYINKAPYMSIEREEYREHLFTYLNLYIIEKIEDLSTEGIKDYFIQNGDNLKYEYHNSYIIYDKESDCFVGVYQRDKLTLEKDYYLYEVEDSEFKLIYSRTEYTRGKL